MAINKKLIHFLNKENFDNEVAKGNILGTSIVFIQDSKEISTHGTVYKTVNWSVLVPELITFTINSTSYQAEKGMTWGDWVNSKYNIQSNISSLNNVYLDQGLTILVHATDIIMANRNYHLALNGSGD